jgi:cell division protein FtsL
MIRLSTLIGLALASVAAGLVMHVSYRVQRTEQYLAKLEREIVREQDQIRVLDAEWSYLNDPARIESLARRHLVLAPMSVKKIVSFDAVPLRDPNAPVAVGPLASKLQPAPLKPLDVTAPIMPALPAPTLVAAGAQHQLAVQKSAAPPAPKPVATTPVPARVAAPATAPAGKLSAREAAAAATRAAAEAAARSRAAAHSDPIGALVLTGGAR